MSIRQTESCLTYDLTSQLCVHRIQSIDGKLACSLPNIINMNVSQVRARYSVSRHNIEPSLTIHILQVTMRESDATDDKQGWIFCPA